MIATLVLFSCGHETEAGGYLYLQGIAAVIIAFGTISFHAIKADISIVDSLADSYVSEGIIPAKKRLDALHVACCVLYKLDYLVSWNYKHLADVNKEKQILSFNFTQNYLHPLRIIAPLELLDYGNDG
ncbi:hypothetical protein BH20BAC1_BH20BAC1_15470 [soil metagenome]